jgi:hypothetical protein
VMRSPKEDINNGDIIKRRYLKWFQSLTCLESDEKFQINDALIKPAKINKYSCHNGKDAEEPDNDYEKAIDSS